MASRRIYGSYVRSMFLRPSSLRLLCPTPFLRHIITANSSSGNSCVVLHRGRVKPAHRCHNADERSEQWRHLTSDARPREPSESAAAAGERGLRILRESFESLEQGASLGIRNRANNYLCGIYPSSCDAKFESFELRTEGATSAV